MAQLILGRTPSGDHKEIAVNADGELRIESDLTVTVGAGLAVDVTSLPTLPAGTNNIGDVDVVSLPALPAGTNNIGNVDIVSLPALPAGTNNIGDVDVVSLPAITGAVTATPPVVALTTVSSTCSSAGSNTIIAAPAAGNRLVIHAMQVQLEEAAAQTVLFKSGSTTKRRFIGSTVGEGLLLDRPHGKEWRLGTAEALNFNLSVAKIVGYTVEYTTEAVP